MRIGPRRSGKRWQFTDHDHLHHFEFGKTLKWHEEKKSLECRYIENYIDMMNRPPHRDADHHDDHGHGEHHRGRDGRRPFDYGELRLLLLTMIVEKPSHGYDLMKGIEERMGGSYSPSPGVIYPTLAWLEDMGYATIDTEQPGRKRYRITGEGETFLVANRASADELVARATSRRAVGVAPVPPSVIRAMENVKLALRLRLRGPLDAPSAEAIASVLDAAAQAIERS